jgi:hypothetical protein
MTWLPATRLEKLVGSKVIDLQGRRVIPGLNVAPFPVYTVCP